MAGTITHAYFSLDLYDRLNIKSKELLINEKEKLKVFAQNTDVLFFYNIANIKKGKDIRLFGKESQKIKTFEFFKTLIDYIKYNNLMYNSEVMAYLYGMLSHYVLDSTVHPLIIYKTGEFNKKKKETRKYNQLHGELESYIDNYFISIKENINPYKFKTYNFCFNINDISDDLKEVIDFTYKEVFNIKDFHKIYLKSIKQTKSFYKVFRYDPYGIKKSFYSIIDLITQKKVLRTVPLSYHLRNMKKYMNLDNKKWCYPTDKTIVNNYSFIDLYNISLNKCEDMIKEINKYIYYDEKIDLKKVIENNSYVTGLDCNKKNKELKYFEF